MRTITVAPISFAKANERTNELCEKINYLYRDGLSTKQIAKELNLSASNVRRYYYGVHNCAQAHYHWKNAFNANKAVGYIQTALNQVRVGACVSI
jgi:orotate phosphoribosyltransferase-like protein